MSCTTCYKDYISCGVTEITVRTGIAAVEQYTVVITHPLGGKYSRTLSSDVFGDIEISLASFPAAMFNPYSGPFLLHIDIGCDDFLFCDYYKYFQFEVLNGDEGKNFLSCCSPSSTDPYMQCCTTTTQTFLDESVTTVPYSGQRPTIEVAYLNADGTFTLGGMGVFTNIVFGPTSFTIDHGGVASGIVKLLK